MASSTSAAGSATRLEAAHGLVRRGGTALLGILALLPLYSFLLAEPNLANRVVPVAMVVGAIVNPSAALLVCAGLLPLNGPIGAMLGSAVDLGEPVTLAFLAGWLLRTAFESRAGANRVAPDVIRPTVLLSVVVAASCAVQLFVIQLWVDYPWGFLRAVAQFVTRDYFRDRATFDVVATGGFWLEGLGLFVAAVTLARRQPALRRRILAMTAAGASGVAALNLNRLMSVSLRSGTTWTVLRESVQHLRVSAVFPDFNAAGSYLAMAFLILAGLAIARPPAGSRHPAARVAWVALLPGVALSLWLTGSRAALVAVAPGALLFVPFGRRWRRPLAVGGGVALVSALVLAPTLTARFDLPETTGRSLQQAFGFRRMMARAALHLTSTHPVFGVGVGAFPGYSSEFIDPPLRQVLPRENAHNNFLQLLAELGVAGFAPFVWLLVAVARLVAAETRAGPTDGAVVGAGGGVLAFCLTSLAGQPLLVQEAALAFWIALGVLGSLPGDTGSAGLGRRWTATGQRWPRALMAAAVLATVASVPVRGHVAVRDATLDTASIGLSAWDVDAQGSHYRRLLGPAQFFVPTSAAFLSLPVRLEAGAHEAELEIRLDGQLANRVRVSGTEWATIETLLPADGENRRYRPVQIAVVAPRGSTDQPQSAGVQLGWPAYSVRN